MKLYRHFDSEGRLLYIGISRNPVARLGEHQKNKDWSDEIATITIEDCGNESAAREAELRAIHDEQPIHNKVARGSRKPILDGVSSTLYRRFLTELAECRERLLGVSLADLEVAAGVSKQHLWNVRQGRQQPSLLILEKIQAGLEALDEAEQGAQ